MSDLKAGPELDRIVAEKVMGMVSCDKWETGNLGRGGGFVYFKGCDHKEDECYPAESCSRYSTDMQAAMQVEDRIAELGLEMDYAMILWREVNDNEDSGELTLWKCIHATPEQRCLAVLKAVESLEVKNETATD